MKHLSNRDAERITAAETFSAKVITSLLENQAYVATKYVWENLVVRATRKLRNRKIHNYSNVEIVVTIGKPNARERDFIKDCKKVGEKFPVKGIILKFPPQPKNK